MLINQKHINHNPIFDNSLPLEDSFIYFKQPLFCHLKKYRVMLGITTRQLSIYSGVNEKYLSRYETKNALPGLDIAKQLVDAINELFYLFFDDESHFICLNDLISPFDFDLGEFSLFNKDVILEERECFNYFVFKNFKYFRELLGLSQTQFANAVGKSNNTIAVFEKNFSPLPSFKTMYFYICAYSFLSDKLSGGKLILNLTFDDLIDFKKDDEMT